MKITGYRLLLAVAVSGLLPVAGAHSQTLEETLVRAYQENPTLRAERARLRATDEGVPQALSNWRPTLQLSGSAGLERSDSTTTGPANKEADVTEPVTGTLTITIEDRSGPEDGGTYQVVVDVIANADCASPYQLNIGSP